MSPAAWRNGIIQNVVLIAVISFLPNVGLATNIGGGLTGAVVALPLWLGRFGRGPQRLLGWCGMVGLVVLGLALMYSQLMPFADSPQMTSIAPARCFPAEKSPGDTWHRTCGSRRRPGPGADQNPAHQSGGSRPRDPAALQRRAQIQVLIRRTARKFGKTQARLAKCIEDLQKQDFKATKWRTAAPAGLKWFEGTHALGEKLIKSWQPGGPIPPADRPGIAIDRGNLQQLQNNWKIAWTAAVGD